MINMKDLIKKQTDMIRKKSGMNIKEETLNEYSPTYDEVGPILADLLNELEDKLKRLNKDKAMKWGNKYHKSASKLNDILKLLIQQLTRIR